MSTQLPNQKPSGAVENPAAFNQHAENLEDGFNLFQCNECGHYAGDPRETNFIAGCPGCERTVKFYRIIE